MQNNFNRILGKVESYEHQDRALRDVEKRALPLVTNLKTGKNYFTPDQFFDVIRYLLPFDDDEKRQKAIKDGKYLPGMNVEIYRVAWLNKDRLVSLSDLARETGIPRATLHRKVDRLNVPGQIVGNRKLYDIDMLRDALELKLR